MMIKVLSHVYINWVMVPSMERCHVLDYPGVALGLLLQSPMDGWTMRIGVHTRYSLLIASLFVLYTWMHWSWCWSTLATSFGLMAHKNWCTHKVQLLVSHMGCTLAWLTVWYTLCNHEAVSSNPVRCSVLPLMCKMLHPNNLLFAMVTDLMYLICMYFLFQIQSPCRLKH